MKNTNLFRIVTCVCLVLIASISTVAAAEDLRRGVPRDCHLAVYARHNAERDYQQEYAREIWQTIQDEKIVEQLIDIVTTNVTEEKLAKARGVYDQIETALAPIDCAALLRAEEFIYAQQMVPPVNHHLFVMRLPSSDAAGFVQGIENLFNLFSSWSEGELTILKRGDGADSSVTLMLPPEVPLRPLVTRVGDVLVLSTSEQLARQYVEQLGSDSPESKFDDPRLDEALSHLPEAEDAVVFFDGRLMFEKLRGIPQFIRAEASSGDEGAERAAQLLGKIIDEFAILDYEVTVEYTDGMQNRTAVIGKLLPDSEDRLLLAALAKSQAFDQWQSWVPADAEGYSLTTGINLHVVYERVMKFVREEIPESHKGLDRWEQVQQEWGVHIDRDILQSFSGEKVSLTLPATAADGSKTQQSVTALRCQNPERIRELLHRGIEIAAMVPAFATQQLALVPCENLDGFEQLQCTMLNAFGVKPVIGFHEGWMVVASSIDAADKVVATRSGEAPSIDQAESFKQFNLSVQGPVYAVRYIDIGASVRQAANIIGKIGVVAPMVVAMAGAQADPEEIKPVIELLGLSPSIAKVVRKFDFLEKSLSVTREGPTENTYRRDGVMLIRAPDSADAVDTSESAARDAEAIE